MEAGKSTGYSKWFVQMPRIIMTVGAGFLFATLALAAIVETFFIYNDAYAAPSTAKKVESHFDSGQWSYVILNPVCGVQGPFSVDVDIKRYHFVLYDDGSYEESFNVRSDIVDSAGTLIASSSLTSKYYTGSTSSLPLESMVNYTLKCGQGSGEPGQVTSLHTRLIIGEDGSVVVAKGY